MTKEILKRIGDLEKALHLGKRIPTQPEFLATWGTLCDLDKTLMIFQSENLDFFMRDASPAERESRAAIAGYLQDMGLLDPKAPKFEATIAEMTEATTETE